MMTILIFAARGGDQDPAVMALGLFFALILIFVAFLRMLSVPGVRTNLEFRNGVPYCPSCGRQVSYSRNSCRSCLYQFRTYGSAARALGPTPHQDEDFKRRMKELIVRLVRALPDRAAREAERHESLRPAREAYYRARGVEPGPLAWYRVLPEWQQAIVLGLALAAPTVVLLALLMR